MFSPPTTSSPTTGPSSILNHRRNSSARSLPSSDGPTVPLSPHEEAEMVARLEKRDELMAANVERVQAKLGMGQSSLRLGKEGCSLGMGEVSGT